VEIYRTLASSLSLSASVIIAIFKSPFGRTLTEAV
jgi:hypothetical protein